MKKIFLLIPLFLVMALAPAWADDAKKEDKKADAPRATVVAGTITLKMGEDGKIEVKKDGRLVDSPQVKVFRIDATKAVDRAQLQKMTDVPLTKLSPEAIQRLRRAHAVRAVAVAKPCPVKGLDAKAVFKAMDKNKDGKVCFKEFEPAFKRVQAMHARKAMPVRPAVKIQATRVCPLGKKPCCPKAKPCCDKCPCTGKPCPKDCPCLKKPCCDKCVCAKKAACCPKGKTCPVTGKAGTCPKAKTCPTAKKGCCPKAKTCPKASPCMKKACCDKCPCAGKPCTKNCPCLKKPCCDKCFCAKKAACCPKAKTCPVTGKAGTCPKAKTCPTAKKAGCPKAKTCPVTKKPEGCKGCPNAKTCPTAKKPATPCKGCPSAGKGESCKSCPNAKTCPVAGGADLDLPLPDVKPEKKKPAKTKKPKVKKPKKKKAPAIPADKMERFKAADKNNDGKLCKNEAPDFMKEKFEAMDKNKDGGLAPKEIHNYYMKMRAAKAKEAAKEKK